MNPRVQHLRDASNRGGDIFAIHYACENLHKATDHPPAITCIVASRLSGGSVVFSRTTMPAQTDPIESEKHLLERYVEFMQSNADALFIHWNMAKASYGFAAIENRYRYLFGGEPTHEVPTSRTIDLDDLVESLYGPDFADHPKLASLAALNRLSRHCALTGPEEAQAFESGNFGSIDRSTEEKVGWIASLCSSIIRGTLETANSAGNVSWAGAEVEAVRLVQALGHRMLYVQRELSHRHEGRPAMAFEDEYDDQDLLRAMLRIFFDDVRPEEHTPSYGGGASRIDFVLPSVAVAIELKHTKPKTTSKNLGDELIVDAKRYAVHPQVRHLVCIVFDHNGYLTNPRGLESDLAQTAGQEGIAVTVLILDR